VTAPAHIIDIDRIVLEGPGRFDDARTREMLEARVREALRHSGAAAAPEVAGRMPAVVSEIARTVTSATRPRGDGHGA
jgi:hypothetical protein